MSSTPISFPPILPSPPLPGLFALLFTSATSKSPKRHARKRPRNRHNQRRLLVDKLSLDILIEIFAYLDPVHLWALSQTSSKFRNTLLDHNINFVWRNALLRTKTPFVPPGFTRLRWIHWLYVVRSCSTPGCQGKDAQVIFSILKRLCLKCFCEQFVSRLRASQHCRFKLTPPEIRAIALPWHVVHHSGHGSMPYYRISDLHALSQEWNIVGRQGLQAQELWLNKKGEDTYTSMKLAMRGQQWIEHMRAEEREDLEARKQLRKKFIYTHLQELGFEDIDIEAAAGHRELRTGNSISEKNWPRVRDILKPIVKQARSQRLALL